MEKRLVKVVDMMVEDRFNEFLIKMNLNNEKLEEMSIAEDFRLTKMTTALEVLQKISKLTIAEIESIINKDINEFYNSYLADYAIFEKLSASIIAKGFKNEDVRVYCGGKLYGIQIR